MHGIKEKQGVAQPWRAKNFLVQYIKCITLCTASHERLEQSITSPLPPNYISFRLRGRSQKFLEWGNINILGLSWLKVGIVQFKLTPSDFAHRDQRLSGWNSNFSTLSSTASVSDWIAAMTSNCRPFNSTFVFIPRCDTRQDVSVLVCPILHCLAHRKSDLFVVAIQKTAHKFPRNLPDV